MKTLRILFSAAALIAAISCNKEMQEPQVNQEPEVAKSELIPMTFTATTTETRTTLDGVSINWLSTDKISVFDGDGNREFTSSGEGATVQFSGEASQAANYYALYPYNEDASFNETNLTASTTLAANQTPSAGTFANGLNINASKSTDNTTFHFTNVLSVAKFTLSGSNLGGKTIKSVKFGSTHPLAGDVVITYGETITATAGSKTVNEITLANENGSALADGTYYFVVLPNNGGAITMTFEATDGCTASVSATLGSAFSAGVIKNLGTVQGLTWEAPKYYTKVTSSDDLEDGQYLIVNDKYSVAFDGGLNVLDAASNTISVNITENGILSNPETDAASFEIQLGSTGSTGSTIKSASGFYIGQTSDANGLKSSTEEQYDNTITIDNQNAVIVSGGAYLRYNSAAGDKRFRYYKSTTYAGQKVIALYKLESVARTPLATPANLSVNSETKTVSWDPVADAASYSVTIGTTTESVSNTSFTFAGDDEYYDVTVIAFPASDAADKKQSAPATLNDAKFGNPVLSTPVLTKGEVDETSIEVTWTVDSRATAGYNASIYEGETKIEEKNATVGNVTFENLTHNKQYTVKVFAKASTEGTKTYGASEVATIDIQTDETVTISKIISDGNTASVTLPTATVMAKQTNYAVLSDETGSILAYKPSGSFKVGDKVKVVGAINTYSNEYQFNLPTVTVTEEGTAAPVYPAENLITTDAPLAAYATGSASTVRVTYATLRGDVNNSGNIVVGNTTVTAYNALTSLKGKTVEAVGYLAGWYKNSSNVTNIYFVIVSAEEYTDPYAPIASVDPLTKTWAYNEVSAQTFAVSTTNCTWDYSPKTLSWASVVANANGITVTPNGEAGDAADNTATITVTFTPTHTGYPEIDPVTISLTQTKAPTHGITVNPSSNPIELSGSANTPYSITVTSNYVWSAQITGSGFTVTPNNGAAGTTEVTITPTSDGGSSVADLGAITFSDGSVSEVFMVKQQEKSNIEKGKAFSYTITNSTPFFSGVGSGTYGDMNWTLASDNAGYWAREDSDGFHMGSGSKSISYATFTLDYEQYCNDDVKKGVAKIVIKAKAAGTNPQLEAWVGNESLGVKTITNSLAEYTFVIEGDYKVGEVKFKLSQTSAKKAIYFKSITINPGE